MCGEFFHQVIEHASDGSVVGGGNHRAFCGYHLAQKRVHLRFPRRPRYGPGHEIDLLHTKDLEFRLLLESLGIEFNGRAVDIEKPERGFAIIFSQGGDGRRVLTASNAMLAGAAEVLVAVTTDRLVGTTVLIILLL